MWKNVVENQSFVSTDFCKSTFHDILRDCSFRLIIRNLYSSIRAPSAEHCFAHTQITLSSQTTTTTVYSLLVYQNLLNSSSCSLHLPHQSRLDSAEFLVLVDLLVELLLEGRVRQRNLLILEGQLFVLLGQLIALFLATTELLLEGGYLFRLRGLVRADFVRDEVPRGPVLLRIVRHTSV